MNEVDAAAKEIVRKAKQSFEHDLLDARYAQIISDSEHLADLLRLCEVKPGKRYLDIGTGAGYLAFEFVRRHTEVSITGVDIVEQVTALNNQKARESNNRRLNFVSYDGMRLPFADGTYHGATSRYAFHHFPKADLSVREIYRVLEPNGWCVISDPIADPADEVDFVNQYALLKDDGHVRYYTETALGGLFKRAGFEVDDKFYSAVTFPRETDQRYKELLARTPTRMLDLYKTRVVKDLIYVTLLVLNIRFKKVSVQGAVGPGR
jgi:ubiquinone/menaquinone biosynthesis C-methylase UbiE